MRTQVTHKSPALAARALIAALCVSAGPLYPVFAAPETEQRVFKAQDGAVIRLGEDSAFEYESWSSGSMCFLRGTLKSTPALQGTPQLQFISADRTSCRGTVRFVDELASKLTFVASSNCRTLCGIRNPPPATPLPFTATTP